MSQQKQTGKDTSTVTPSPSRNNRNSKQSSSKKEAMRQRQLKRRRNQIILVGIGVVVVAIIGIFTIVALSTPTSFDKLPASSTQDTDYLTLGAANAQVALIEYADVRCPACKQYFDQADSSIRDTFVKTGQIKYIFRNYTVVDDILRDSDSQRGAQAIRCAADQKRGWDFRDSMYANYRGESTGVITDKVLKDLAKALGLNQDQFNSCLDTSKYKQAVADEKTAAKAKGVSGTPTFFLSINGAEQEIQYSTYDDIKSKIAAAVQQNPPTTPK
ncbi:MAG: thioredoxin domain-containing protein [Chloroflexi bacterium]|uniref:DsbA family protein n=1 Tax=Candidatus Chlorohelix allophototropha TaxID=3003348 RepID=A0A8T7M2C2_9CHLR|nr:thioredoxin domain-containing protein [Chloroflexota bacterium]WJW65760.1 DsbA family protein [Chloroflexota bacterium L227-S17]